MNQFSPRKGSLHKHLGIQAADLGDRLIDFTPRANKHLCWDLDTRSKVRPSVTSLPLYQSSSSSILLHP